MQISLPERTERYVKAHARRNAWRKLVTVLSCIVVFCTTYALILPAITMTGDTFCGKTEHVHSGTCYDNYILSCGQEEGQGHTHSDECFDENGQLVCSLPETPGHTHTEACYTGNLICQKEEHTHTLSCYADPDADVEDAAVWERTLPALTGNWAEDVAAIARSQMGYTQSLHNYQVAEDGTVLFYSRYGQWYGEPYGKWDALFVSFCLHYANVPETAFPQSADCAAWVEALRDQGLYSVAWTPNPGDLIFFDDTVGVVVDCSGETVTVMFGETAVSALTLSLSDPEIQGYGTLPENTPPREPKCGKEEHVHTEDCFDETGAPVCGKEEHTHTEDCFADASQEFTYEDHEISVTLRVEGEALPETTEVALSPVSEDRQQAVSGSVQDAYGEDPGILVLRSVTLTDNGQELDLSGHRVYADVAMKESTLAPLTEQLAAIADAAPEADLGIRIAALQVDEEQLTETNSVYMPLNAQVPTLTAELDGSELVLRASTANPHYTVQYYANILRFTTSGDKQLTVFDTSAVANEGTAKTPKNNKPNPTKFLYLVKTGGQTQKNAGDKTNLYTVDTADELTEMYTGNAFEYIKSPNPSYVNKLIDSDSYTLSEVWVLKDGRSAASTSRDDWDIYGPNVHFTNRSDITRDDVIYIKENSVLRMVYNVKKADFTAPATFYDYDISSGKSNGKWLTGTTGINISSNYTSNDKTKWDDHRDILAFGNDNCGTGMSRYKFGGVFLNKYSTTYMKEVNGENVSVPISNFNQYGCTFGLATGMSDGKIVYSDWLLAPKLFNEGTANGKHTYENSSLTFSRVGDTYTLSSASVNGVGSIDGLQEFFNPSPKTETTHTGIFTNDFWPMDAAKDKTDPLFGAAASTAEGYNVSFQGFSPYTVDGSTTGGSWTNATGNLPVSDDGNAHNSFFGMQYAVKFHLTADYVGPLEYYFFGDDDMWVFLDNQLVCDIGGVHSSVGEYVNLWDYLEKGSTGEHTLTFFYTERGASGSTCYMNFTLPSVSGVNIEQTSGDLIVKKEVVGDDDSDKDFRFQIQFYSQTGEEILDDYAYTKYTANGTENDLVLHDGSEFTLKAGESIKIEYLPIGLRYKITELDPGGYTVTNTVNGVVSTGTNAVGTIIKDSANSVLYTNTLNSVGLKLQKLTADGKALSGAKFSLKNDQEETVRFVSNGGGSYTVPASASELIDFDENGVSTRLYYIALAGNPDWVLGKDSGENAVLRPRSADNAEKLRIYRNDDGSYSFLSDSLNKWLDLDANGKFANGTTVHFYRNTSETPANDYQKWYLSVNGDGTLKIKPRIAALSDDKDAQNRVLDLNGATVQDGTKIQFWDDNGSPAQKWSIVPVDPAAELSTTTELAVNDSGLLTLSGLLPGTYTLTEIAAPEGFVKLETPIPLHVDAQGNVTLPDGAENPLISLDGSTLQVKNNYTDRKLTLTKLLQNSTVTTRFPFRISYTKDGETVEKDLSLSGGETSEPIEIPYGATVTITETAHDGFQLTFRQGDTLLETDTDGAYTFTITQDVTIQAVNTACYALPNTGGPGVQWYAAGGLLLTAGSLILGNRLRRKRERRSSS